ncbi:MAG: hypothetical protein PUP46_07685 [Endozoicomonas sp. (ex Botrylloides leachii)]|nr:hypothetical protein [Endozoicomonas sp. (ex Botrylloides leachii)]
MKLKISVFSFLIPLLLTFSYSTYGGDIYKRILLSNIESCPLRVDINMEEHAISAHILYNLESSCNKYFLKNMDLFRTIKNKYSLVCASDIKFQLYKKLHKNCNAINDESHFDETLDLGEIKGFGDMVEKTNALVEKMFSDLDNKELQ